MPRDDLFRCRVCGLEIHGAAPLMLLHGDLEHAVEQVSAWRAAGMTVGVVRGRTMRTVAGLFHEVSAALQFPSYFGENWAAFDESLADMEWTPSSAGLVVAVLDAVEVLSDEPEAEMATLVSAVARAAQTYAEPIDSGEWWDRPPVPFHVVLQAGEGEETTIRTRWGASGATFSVLGRR